MSKDFTTCNFKTCKAIEDNFCDDCQECYCKDHIDDHSCIGIEGTDSEHVFNSNCSVLQVMAKPDAEVLID